MAPAGATLVAVGIKAVVLTNGGKFGVHNAVHIDTGIHQRLANSSGKIEHTGTGSIDAREFDGKAIHKLAGHLVLVAKDMGPNIGRDVLDRPWRKCAQSCPSSQNAPRQNR